MLLGLNAIMLILEAIHFLIKFARLRDMFVCDSIAIVKICERVVYHMYCDSQCCFQCGMFINFLALVNFIHELSSLDYKSKN
jgi:hypothetical protein